MIEGLKGKFHLPILGVPILDMLIQKDSREAARKNCGTRKTLSQREIEHCHECVILLLGNPRSEGHFRPSTEKLALLPYPEVSVAIIAPRGEKSSGLSTARRPSRCEAQLWSLLSSESRNWDVVLAIRSGRVFLVLYSL